MAPEVPVYKPCPACGKVGLTEDFALFARLHCSCGVRWMLGYGGVDRVEDCTMSAFGCLIVWEDEELEDDYG